jgi:hypothetical protein
MALGTYDAERRLKPRRKHMFQQALEKVSKQVLIRDRYGNFIDGKWVAPVTGLGLSK